MKKGILFFLSLMLCTQICAAQKVVLFLIDRVDWEELATWQEKLPNFKWILEEGAIGLLNTRTDGGTSPESAYLTVGTGTRAMGNKAVLEGYQTDEMVEKERAEVVYGRRVGRQGPAGSVLALELGSIIAVNQNSAYGAVVGALGQAIHEAGLRTAVLGCADTVDTIRRPHVAVAMDQYGLVDFGTVGKKLLKKDPTAAFGLATDREALLAAFQEVKNKADFLVIDFGDTARVEEYRDYLTDEMLQHHRLEALKSADAFLGALRGELDWERTQLLVATPTPALAAMKDGRRLTPIMAIGRGYSHGYLTGPTTRRPAVVGNIDIAPTVLAGLGIKGQPGWSGRAFFSQPQPQPLKLLLDHNRKLVSQNNMRVPFNQTYVFYLIVAITVATMGVFGKNAGLLKQQQNLLLQKLLLAAMAVPLVTIILPSLPGSSTWWVLPEAIGLTVILVWVLTSLPAKNMEQSLLLLSLLTVAAIALDLFRGGPQSQYSFLGYSAIIGARFYGLGNEYMGVLLGAALVVMAAWLERGGRLVPMCLFFLFVTAIVGFPALGANVGGTITAVAAFTLASFRILDRKVKLRQVLGLLGLVALAVAGMALADHLLGSGASHLGKSLGYVGSGQWHQIFLIIGRKVSMNLRLIRYTIWTRVLLFFLAASVVIAIRPQGVLRGLFAQKRGFAISFYAAALGCIAAFVFNDSGVVAAATMMIFPVLSLFFLLVEKES